jgi:hypothetical protein
VGVLVQDPPIGSHTRRPPEGTAVEKDDAAAIRQTFATCIYKQRQAAVERLLATSDTLNVDFNAAGIRPRQLSSALDMDKCLGRAESETGDDLTMTVKFASLRAMLIEQSYRNHNPAGANWVRNPAVVPARRFVSEGDDLVNAQGIASFADCVVVRAPREADALIRTPAGTPAETAAVTPLVPHLGPCIPQGVQIVMNAGQLRAVLADGLWAAWRAATSAPTTSASAR